MQTVDRIEVVKAFCEECVWLRAIRKHFADLFESNDERSQLLFEVAGAFFHDLNLVLIEYILLQQCKLTDPASSGQDKDNLTTNFILQLEWSPATKAILQEQNEKLLTFRNKVVDARRKLVAHLDLRARLGTLDLGQFSQAEEVVFWQALQTFVDAAHSEVIGGPYEIDASMQDGDVASLVHHLKDAVDYNHLIENEPNFLSTRFGRRRFEGA
jgi:hypothetical protein